MLSASVKFQNLAVVVSFKKKVLHSKNILPTPPPRNSVLSFPWSKKTLRNKKVAFQSEPIRVAPLFDTREFSEPTEAEHPA